MPDPGVSRTISIEGDVAPFKAALGEAMAELEKLKEAARSVGIGAGFGKGGGASGGAGPAEFAMLGRPGGSAPTLPSSAAGFPRAGERERAAMSFPHPPQGKGDKLSATGLIRFAEVYESVRSTIANIIGGGPAKPSAPAAAPGAAPSTAKQLSQVVTATGKPTMGAKEHLAAALRKSGATEEEIATTLGGPAPRPPRAPKQASIGGALEGLAAATAAPTAVRSVLGPLGSMIGLGAIGGGVAFGMQFAPQASSLGMALGGRPNLAYQNLLTNPAVMKNFATPTEAMQTGQTLLQTSGRMASGARASIALFSDVSAASEFARAVGISPQAGAGILGTAEQAGIIAPGQAGSITPSLYAQAARSGMPLNVYSTGAAAKTRRVSRDRGLNHGRSGRDFLGRRLVLKIRG